LRIESHQVRPPAILYGYVYDSEGQETQSTIDASRFGQ